MKNYFLRFLSVMMWIASKIYPYRLRQRVNSIRDIFYTMWIENFMGKVGEKCRIQYPLLLQGGGQRRVSLGSNTSLGHHCILGCWESYTANGVIECYEPEIIIGNDCNIGEYCHITAINKISIGDGLLTGRFVYIGDNAHGGLHIDRIEIL